MDRHHINRINQDDIIGWKIVGDPLYILYIFYLNDIHT